MSARINFAKIVDVEPSPISCMSLNHATKKLALFRGGNIGVIEIWDVMHQPFLQKILPDMETIEGKASVESIVWVGNRLFSCGLHGFLIEHNIFTGRMMYKSAATSGSVWCLGVNPTLDVIAAGTEDGFLNLFKVEEKSLTYLRVLDRQDGRVLCLQWSHCGRYIATGSVDSVRLWDVVKGHAVQKLMTGRTKNRETIVWSVLMLDDLVIVAGDSRGIISFWDGKIGVLKFKIQTHKADVLTLRLSTDKYTIYAAGVDPSVVSLTRLGHSDRWVRSHTRNIHLNDVLTLETCGSRCGGGSEQLFSGGIDSDLILSSFPPKVVVKFPNIPAASAVKFSEGLVLVRNVNSLNIWRLPDGTNPLKKLIHLLSKKNETIHSADISSNVFGYATKSSVQFFKVEDSKIHKIPLANKPSQVLEIILTESKMVLLTPTGIALAGLKNPVFSLTELDKGPTLGLTNYQNDTLCVTSDNRITLYKLEKEITKHCDLPKLSSIPSLVSLHPTSPLILVTYVDNTILLFNTEQKKIIFQEKLAPNHNPFQGAVWTSEGAILFKTDSILKLEKQPQIKRSKPENINYTLKSSTNRYKHLINLGLHKDEIIAVEVDGNMILEQLPPAFAKKKFGV